MIAETKFYGATGGRKFVLALRERKREKAITPQTTLVDLTALVVVQQQVTLHE